MSPPEAIRLLDFIATRRHQLVEVAATRLCRITSHSTGEPFFSRSQHNRFDEPNDLSKLHYGVNYCALTLQTAFAESVLHNELHFDSLRNRWVVSLSAVLQQRWVVNLARPGEPLINLFPLCGDLLTRLNIDNSISAGNNYTVSKALSRVVHDHEPQADGILYVSNRANRSLAVALFDRSKVTAQEAEGHYLPLIQHPQFHATLAMYDVITTP